jgi:hypothetical protein
MKFGHSLGRKYFYRAFLLCCGSGSGIRCLFDPWIRDPGWVRVMRPRNKPPGSSVPQTSDAIYTCTKSYGAMNANDPVISRPWKC